MFGAVKLTKNADPDNLVLEINSGFGNSCSGYGIGFDSRSLFTVPNFDCGKNAVIFGVGNGSLVYVDNKKKILVLSKVPRQGLDDTTITAVAEYSINLSRLQRKFCSSLHYTGSNSFLFVNTTKIYQFKAKDSEIKPYPLCWGNISKYFTTIKKHD